ncbi:MAG: 2-amino-4-hydroxy-6-hydroxymethyldihydropteridine diphosphokinase, partial [Chitinophagaceae bacterium]|nr:2-amino-4-hydroxy-6-hydroxymethyldihydropteridine diphosphokinase [Chitinophagaceae bacterium]
MNHVYLITGGNIGDASRQLATARRLLEEHCGAIIDSSSVYETEPWGKSAQGNFLNQVLVIETGCTAWEVIQAMTLI